MINFQSLEQIYMVRKIFELLRFDLLFWSFFINGSFIKTTKPKYLSLSVLQTKTVSANSVDPDETAYRGDSNEYTKHTIILKKIEKTSLNYSHLPPALALWLTLSGSKYPCLEKNAMVQKIFEPLKFDCI